MFSNKHNGSYHVPEPFLEAFFFQGNVCLREIATAKMQDIIKLCWESYCHRHYCIRPTPALGDIRPIPFSATVAPDLPAHLCSLT